VLAFCLLSTVCICYAAPGLQAANFLTIFGALTASAGSFVLAAIREISPNVTAIVLAGVVGTAITADRSPQDPRGADALQVLGVDPVKNLVVPASGADAGRPGCSTSTRSCSASSAGPRRAVNGQPLGPFWTTCSPTPPPRTCGARR
jgi:phospholipid/cholesterol/gamma-HCH transport system permease protein